MSDLRAIDEADVYKADSLAGFLRRRGNDIEFGYHATYADDPATPPVAWTLPKSGERVVSSGDSVPPFFAGLLPEGVRLRSIVRTVKTSEDDHLALLLAVGSDTVGDVRIVPAGNSLTEPAPAFDPRGSGGPDLASMPGLIAGPDSLSFDRAAIPGVQPKVSAIRYSTPVVTTEGAAILKLSSPTDFPRLVENEHFFLDVASACGLRTPKHELERDDAGTSGLLVERFDRVRGEGGLIRRLAQEDACQVLNLYPARKYKLKAEDAIQALAAACEHGGGSARLATLELIRLVAFSYLIGNGDLHGKNMSIRQTPNGIWSVTPAYDLVCTQPYLRWRDPMALDLYARANKLTGSRLIEAGTKLSLPERAVRRMLDQLADGVAAWIARVGEIGYDDKTTAMLQRFLTTRKGELLRMT